MAKESRATAGMGGGKKSGKSGKSGSKGKHPHSIHIKRGASGGFIVTHHHKAKEGEQAQEPEDHVVPDMDQLQQHLAENMGDQPDQGAEPSPEAAPPAQAQAGPGGPPQAGM